MSRIRTIKPEFWRHEDLSALPEATHMLAAALLNYADDEGYFNANPKLVQAECCPLREPSVSVHDSLTSLCEVGFIRISDGSDGKRYGHVVKFLDHQRINRPTPSKIKCLVLVQQSAVSTHTQLTEPSPPEGKGREQGTGNAEPIGSGADAPCAAVPIAVQSRQATDPDSVRDLIWKAGLTWCAEASDKPPDKLRSWLGRLCSRHGEPEVLAAIATAQRDRPVDPVAWIERKLNGKRPDDDLRAFADDLRAGVAG